MAVVSTNILKSRLDRFMQHELQEPTVTWGIRMAFVTILPVVVGMATGRLEEAEWVALAAEATCWVDLKGGWAMRLRTLLIAGILGVGAGMVGTLTAPFISWSVLAVGIAAFVAAWFKNLGQRGASLGTTIGIMMILANAHPVASAEEFGHRTGLLLLGALLNLITGVLFSVVLREQQPYRASIGAIWASLGTQLGDIAQILNRSRPLVPLQQRYQQERAVRQALDNSLELFEGLPEDSRVTEDQSKALALLRRHAGITAALISGIEDPVLQLRTLRNGELTQARLALGALQEACRACGWLSFSQRIEDQIIVLNRLERAEELLELFAATEEASTPAGRNLRAGALRIIRLLREGAELAMTGNDRPHFAAYSSLKISLILHPRYWWRHARSLASISSHLTRYAARTAIAAALGVLLYKTFDLRAGHWLPFTTMLLAQPYFGTTLKKSRDRILGTIGGATVASLLLYAPAGLLLKEIGLAISSFLMVYYVRKKYWLATAFITINVMLIFSVATSLDPGLLPLRVVLTCAGAFLALLAGFFVLPAWERKYLPSNLMAAFLAARNYYVQTAATPFDGKTWLAYKRIAEKANAESFDAYNRLAQEPGRVPDQQIMLWFNLLNQTLKVTRLVNGLNVEAAFNDQDTPPPEREANLQRLHQQVIAAWEGLLPRLAEELHQRQPSLEGGPHTLFLRPEWMPHAGYELQLRRLLEELLNVHDLLDHKQQHFYTAAAPRQSK